MNTTNITSPAVNKTYEHVNDIHVQPLKADSSSVMVKPIMSTSQIVEGYKEYEDLKAQLLKPSDYQEIQGKTFIKKSGFRKLATAFWISIEIIKEERRDLKDSNWVPYFVYEITAKAIAPNMRFTTACASCSSNERRFTHADHDVRSTAQTRAVNRSVSDLVWGWEVSAEEMMSVNNTAWFSSTQHTSSYSTSYSSASSKARTEIVNKPGYASSNANTSSTWSTSPATQAQKSLLIRLVEKKYLDEPTRNDYFKKIEALSKSEASLTIQKLLGSK